VNPAAEGRASGCGLDQDLIEYRRSSPTFSLVTVSPCFFARDPPALMSARVVWACRNPGAPLLPTPPVA
jgi:hypothetical protein